MMKFEKIVTSPNVDVEENLLVAGKDRLFSLPLKGIQQTDFSYFHRTTLNGGSVATFDLRTEVWSGANSFGAIDVDQNREDFAFAVMNSLFMVVYSRFEDFKIHSILKWDETELKWMALKLTVDSALKLSAGNRLEVSFYQEPFSNVLHFIVSGREGSDAIVGELDVLSDAAKATLIRAIPSHVLPSQSLVMKLAKHGANLYATIGRHGCGVRWENGRLLRIPLAASASVEYAEVIGGRGPGYSFGPMHGGVVGPAWVVLGGDHMGMDSSVWDPAVWSLRLDPELGWSEQPVGHLPKELDRNTFSTALGDGGVFYIFDPKEGLYKSV